MQRLINPRFFLFGAIGLVLGVLCGYSIMFGKLLLPLLFVGLLAVALTILLLLKNKLYLVVTFVFIFTIFGCGVFQLNLLADQKQEVIARPVTLTGRVTDIGRTGSVTNVIYLENCVYDDVEIDGRVRVTVFDGASFQTGDILTVAGTLRSTYVFADDFDTSYLRNDCHYQLTDISVLSCESGALTVDETIRNYIYQTCNQSMFNYTGLMYALITGDDNALAEDVKSYYQASGMIHLIAVSGMHLVYIITIIGFFINKLKLNPLTEFAVMIGPLVFFCYVCNWAPSILRALLMTVCMYLVRWLYGRYDMLVSLSWSVVVLLFVNPYYLFDIGWQLSVLSVLGMATLHLRFDRFLQSKKMGKFAYGLLSALSISLSCTLATFATIAHYFGEVPVLGVVANLVGVPLMSWAFTLGIVGLLPWVFHYALHPADGILWLVTEVAKAVSSLDFAVVSLTAISLAIAVSVVWLFVAGQYVNLKKVAKVVVNCTLCVVLVACFVFTGIPKPHKDQVYVSYDYSGANVVVSNKQGEFWVLSNCENYYAFNDVETYLSQFDYHTLVWVIADFSKYSVQTVPAQFLVDVGVDKVYHLTPTVNAKVVEQLQSKNIPVTQVANNQTVGEGITVQSIFDGSLSGAVISTGEITFAMVYGNVTQADYFLDIIPSADFYVLSAPTERYFQQNLTTFSLYQDYCVTNYGANKYGNFTISQKDGTIIVSF